MWITVHTCTYNSTIAYQILDEFEQVCFGGFGILFAANDGDGLNIVVTSFLRENDASLKLVTNLTQETRKASTIYKHFSSMKGKKEHD